MAIHTVIQVIAISNFAIIIIDYLPFVALKSIILVPPPPPPHLPQCSLCEHEHALTIPYTLTADILDRVTPKLHELGVDYECVGGGRIRHNSNDKKIHIYGYSVVSPLLLSVVTIYSYQCDLAYH